MSVLSKDAKLAYRSQSASAGGQDASEGSPQFDVGQLQVPHDLQLVDAAEVLDAVSELKQVGSVHRQLELMGLAQDEDLRGDGWTRHTHTHTPVCFSLQPGPATIPQSTPPGRRGRRAAPAPPDPRTLPGKSS